MEKIWNYTTPAGVRVYEKPIDFGLLNWQCDLAKDLGITVVNIPTESMVYPQEATIAKFAKLYGALASRGFKVSFWFDKWGYDISNWSKMMPLINNVATEFGNEIIYNIGQEVDAVWQHNNDFSGIIGRISQVASRLRQRGIKDIWCGGRTQEGTVQIASMLSSVLSAITYTGYDTLDKVYQKFAKPWEQGFGPFLANEYKKVIDTVNLNSQNLPFIFIEEGWTTFQEHTEQRQVDVYRAVQQACISKSVYGIGMWCLTDFWDAPDEGNHSHFGLVKLPGVPKPAYSDFKNGI